MVTDHSVGHPLDHSSTSLHSPFYGFSIQNNGTVAATNASTYNAEFLDAYISFAQHANQLSGPFNSLTNGGAYLTGALGVTTARAATVSITQSHALPTYPPFLTYSDTSGAYNSNYMMRSDYNDEGFEKLSINDIVVENIARGNFPRTLYGLKMIGITRTNYNINAYQYDSYPGNEKYISSNETPSKTYLMFTIGKNVFAMPKA